ncbi:PQQ-binding-like beta-propeller repeat protein [bacterium]|nr:PQQ-binding-like beta-propeller repeat protein [bacterium]
MIFPRSKFAVMGVLAASLLGCATAQRGSDYSDRNLTFLHISDTHIGPYLEERSAFAGERSDATFQFMEKVQGDPQPVMADGSTVPAPSFVVHTGDVTEYGFPGGTLAAMDSYHKRFKIPVFWAPGNHDNTWVSRPDMFRERQGGMHFHFAREGVHIIGINSATLQEPVQSISEEEVAFVADCAKDIPSDAPIFVMLHHPPSSGDWSSEYDLGRLMEPLRDHNVAGLLVGHHHAATHEKWSGYHVIHGGSTFSKADAAKPVDGFGVINIHGSHLHAAYRYKDDRVPAKQFLDRDIAADPNRLSLSPVVAKTMGNDLAVAWRSSRETPVVVTIQGVDTPIEVAAGTTTIRQDVSALGNGRHWGKVSVGTGDSVATERFFEFALDRPARPGEGVARWRQSLGGGVKGTPLVDGNQLVIGVNNQTLQSIDRGSGKRLWRASTPGEVLGGAVRVGDEIMASTTEGFVVAYNPDSGTETRRVRVPSGLPLYSAPLATGDLIIVGGADADLYALDRQSLAVRWTASQADYSVEMPPLVVGDSLVYNAWDGYVHAVSLADGTELWKSSCPRNQKGFSRYYGGADNTPVVMEDRVYTTDRGYHAGMYSAKGEFLGLLLEDCSALTRTEDGRGLLARRLAKPLCRLSPTGAIQWESTVTAGRLPVPPVEVDGKVYVVARGVLYALNGADGKTLWQYQVTPGLTVLAAPVVADGVVYAVGVDGVLTAVAAP